MTWVVKADGSYLCAWGWTIVQKSAHKYPTREAAREAASGRVVALKNVKPSIVRILTCEQAKARAAESALRYAAHWLTDSNYVEDRLHREADDYAKAAGLEPRRGR